MKSILSKTGFATLSMLVVLFFSFPQAEAKTKKVNCDKGQKIQKALDNAKGGDVVEVKGTCSENIRINKNRITLRGVDGATLTGPDISRPTIRSRGQNVRIEDFASISGGFRVIAIQNGGSAVITGNTIEGAQTFGVQISQNTYGAVLNNTIQNNGTDGVNVRLGSGADVFDNTITGNRDGVNVDSGGSADLSGNNISGNTRDGVHLRDNSHVRFSSDPNNMIINVIELNGDNGVDCARGGTISGNPVDFGAGNTGGNKDIAGSCRVQGGVLP